MVAERWKLKTVLRKIDQAPVVLIDGRLRFRENWESLGTRIVTVDRLLMMGLIRNSNGVVSITDDGREFMRDRRRSVSKQHRFANTLRKIDHAPVVMVDGLLRYRKGYVKLGIHRKVVVTLRLYGYVWVHGDDTVTITERGRKWMHERKI